MVQAVFDIQDRSRFAAAQRPLGKYPVVNVVANILTKRREF